MIDDVAGEKFAEAPSSLPPNQLPRLLALSLPAVAPKKPIAILPSSPA